MFIKSGSVTRSERCSKYNRLILLEELDKNLIYGGLEAYEKNLNYYLLYFCFQ